MSADTADRIQQLLDALYDPTNTAVDPADQVADRLRALDIKGVPGEPCECPLAKYLHVNGVDDVEVEGPTVTFTYEVGDSNDWWVVYDHVVSPAPIAEFIVRFDEANGPYADLIEAVEVAS